MHQGCIGSNGVHCFSQLVNLKALDVSDTDMGNAELQQLQALTRLRSLNLTWTKVTRPPLVSSLTSLELGNVEVQRPLLYIFRFCFMKCHDSRHDHMLHLDALAPPDAAGLSDEVAVTG